MAPRDPSNCRGWMRLSCWPAFQQTVRTAVSTTTKVDVPSGAYRSPVRCDAATLSDSRLGATTVKATAGCCPPSQLRPLEVEWARGVLASGMPVGIRLCGVRRRHLFGCKGAVSGLWGPDTRGCVTISAASIRRASSAGGSILDLAPAGSAPCPIGLADWPVGSWLKLALVGSIAQPFWDVSRGWMAG